MINIGTSPVKSLFTGTSSVKRVYAGSDLVYEAMPSASLAVFYKFDGSLGYAKDESANGRNGTIVGSITQNQTGKIGESFLWAESAVYPRVTITPAITLSGPSISFNAWLWQKDSARAALKSIFGDGAQSNDLGYFFYYVHSTQTRIVYQIRTTASTNVSLALGYVFTGLLETWVMVTFCMNYTTGDWQCYRNGVLFSSGSVGAGVAIFPASSRIRHVGNYSTSYTGYWEGKIDDFAIFDNYILTADDVARIYNNGNGLTFP